jgi:hypothetical protein
VCGAKYAAGAAQDGKMASALQTSDDAIATDGDVYVQSSDTKTRGRGRAWLPEENLGVVLAICQLPDAAIDGANMRSSDYEGKVYNQFVKHVPSLDDFPDQSKLWRGRSSRSCVGQWKTVAKDCVMLHSRFRQVQRASPTGKPSADDLMRVAVGLFNKSINLSNVYDVVHDKAYDIGKAFAFMNCYDMLCERFPARIEPTSVGTSVIGTIRCGSPLDTTKDAVDAYTEDGRENEEKDGDGPAGAPRSRPQGTKAANRSRIRQTVSDHASEDIASVSAALSSYTEAFKAVSDKSLAQNSENFRVKRLRASASSLRAGLDACQVLFGKALAAPTVKSISNCCVSKQCSRQEMPRSHILRHRRSRGLRKRFQGVL